jgi:hypothetical protein
MFGTDFDLRFDHFKCHADVSRQPCVEGQPRYRRDMVGGAWGKGEISIVTSVFNF